MSSEKRTALIRTAIPVILLIIFYTGWLYINEIYGIIAGIIMLAFLFMRSAKAPKEERLPIGEFCVLMLGVVRIISDIKLRHYFTAICGVPLLFVLYAVILQYQKLRQKDVVYLPMRMMNVKNDTQSCVNLTVKEKTP